MHFIPIIMFVVSSNLDNLVIGLSYGLKGIRIGAASNLLIGLITLVGTVLSMGLGKSLLLVLPPQIAGMLGSVAIILIGVYFLASWLWKRHGNWPRENPEKFDWDQSNNIDLREAVGLGLALTVNNMGLGIGASIMGMSVLATSIGSCLASLLCLYLGNKAGRGWFSKALGRWAEPLSGIIIILMGLYELIF